MDWAKAIARNREALIGIVAALFAMLGLEGSATVARVPRSLRGAVLRVLQPAESAVRRLVVVAARGLVVKRPPPRPMPAGRIIGRGGTPRLSFQLFDPRRHFARQGGGKIARNSPRIHVFFSDPRLAAMPMWSTTEAAAEANPLPDEHADAQRLCRRLHALKRALDDLPRQARRLARWRAKRERMPSPKFTSPLRPGRPPGYRCTPVHDIDQVLINCHALAFDALHPGPS